MTWTGSDGGCWCARPRTSTTAGSASESALQGRCEITSSGSAVTAVAHCSSPLPASRWHRATRFELSCVASPINSDWRRCIRIASATPLRPGRSNPALAVVTTHLRDTADGWEATERAVGSASVVPPQPGGSIGSVANDTRAVQAESPRAVVPELIEYECQVLVAGEASAAEPEPLPARQLVDLRHVFFAQDYVRAGGVLLRLLRLRGANDDRRADRLRH